MTFFKKNFFNLFLLLYFLIGIVLSLSVGITHDEPHNNWVWELNKKKLYNIFLNQNYEVDNLENYHGYYGIGFYIISTPVEIIFSNLLNFIKINDVGGSLLIKHPTVFIFYLISGIYFKKIIFLLTKDKSFSCISCIFYLTYPYILGHSLFNIKDIPFMSIWLINTFLLIKILNNVFFKNILKKKDLIFLSILTAYLLSIRISGLLIFIEYIIFLIFYLQTLKFKFYDIFKNFYKSFFSFLFLTIFFTFLFYPNFWEQPLKFIDAVSFMSQHIQTACTVTLGDCMKSQNLPSSYLFIWLFFKLPLVITFGLIIIPFLEKKIFIIKNNILILGPLICTILSLIFLLIFLKVNLYDELRQVLFLIPLIMIISIYTLYFFSKRVSYLTLILFTIFFIFQNYKIFPYNYLWLNNLNLLTNINKNFEKDYWGVSTKEVANYFDEIKIQENTCIISNRNDGIKYFLSKQDTCFKPFNHLYKKNLRPFYVVFTERALRKSPPNNCFLNKKIYIKINLSPEEVTIAKVYKCV